jgi:hypothetical protein
VYIHVRVGIETTVCALRLKYTYRTNKRPK